MTDERMKAQWFRWHHGTTTDRKWPSIALRARTSVAAVIAVWACLLESASQNDDRGYVHVSDDDADDLDAALGLEPETTRRIVAEMSRRDIVTVENRVAAWDKRQPKREREDKTAAERKRRQRERERAESNEKPVNDRQTVDTSANVTPCHATGRHDTPRGEERRVEEKQELSPSAVAFTPNPPQAAALVGTFEGHDRNSAKSGGGESIAAPHAIALRQRGLSMTSMNPNLIAFAKDGGTVDHLLEVAEIHGQRGAGYVLTVARRELAEKAAEVRTVEATPITAAQRRPGQTLTALALLQEDKTWTG